MQTRAKTWRGGEAGVTMEGLLQREGSGRRVVRRVDGEERAEPSSGVGVGVTDESPERGRVWETIWGGLSRMFLGGISLILKRFATVRLARHKFARRLIMLYKYFPSERCCGVINRVFCWLSSLRGWGIGESVVKGGNCWTQWKKTGGKSAGGVNLVCVHSGKINGP